PVLRVLESDERSSQAKPVLRRHAAGSNVQRMVGKQFVSATGNQLQAETATGFANVFSLTAKVGLQISFLGERNRGYKKHCRYQNPTHTALRAAQLFLSLAL